MKTAKQKEDRADRVAIIYSGVAVAVCFAVVVIAVFIGSRNLFAWFVGGREVDADGNKIGVHDTYELVIRKTAGGEDISVAEPDDKLEFSSFPEAGLLRPGYSGAFDAYIVYGENILNPSYYLSVKCTAVEDTTSINNGYRDDTSYDHQVKALQLIKTHIVFFLNKDESGMYSDWIPPGENKVLNCTESVLGEEQHITIYWMWLETYEELLAENNTKIAAADRAKMIEHINNNPADWFFGSDYETLVQRRNEYNNGDAFLATVMESVMFKTEFSVS